MKRSYHIPAAILTVLCCWAAALAEVKLPTAISDGVVLQRDVPAAVWGTADPGEKVSVAFAGQNKQTLADRYGRWRVKLNPLSASARPRPLTVAGPANAITVKTVYVGDVWLYLSPSFHLNSKLKTPMDAGPGTIISACAADLWEHNNHSQRPLSDGKGAWGIFKEPGRYFRNDGYYLGLGIARYVKVPVGIIGLNGTTLESMTPPEGFQAYEKELGELGSTVADWVPHTTRGKSAFLKKLDDIERWARKTEATLREEYITFADVSQPPEVPGPPALGRAPTTFYNKVIHRFTPSTIRGIIIQPKSYNVSDPLHLAKARALIKGLRTVFGNEDLPVCYVQMHSPGRYEIVKPDDPQDIVVLRDRQGELAGETNTTVLAAYDLIKTGNSEPDAGLRAAQWAVAQVKNEAVKTGPVYRTHKTDGKRIVIDFDNVGNGLLAGKHVTGKAVQPAEGGRLDGFEIAGADGKFRKAVAKIDGSKIIVSSDTVDKPLSVRYAWQVDARQANLYNKNGFPALPFSK